MYFVYSPVMSKVSSFPRPVRNQVFCASGKVISYKFFKGLYVRPMEGFPADAYLETVVLRRVMAAVIMIPPSYPRRNIEKY
jgi:hypothetical protein